MGVTGNAKANAVCIEADVRQSTSACHLIAPLPVSNYIVDKDGS
jgi:hypothetical protein